MAPHTAKVNLLSQFKAKELEEIAEEFSLGEPFSVAGLHRETRLNSTVSSLERILHDHMVLISARFLVAQASPLVLSYMIWKTLKDFRNTMAATGLFYIALLGVFVGELLSHQLFALTLVPL